MARKKRKPPRGAAPAGHRPPVDVVLAVCRSARAELLRPGCRGLDAELWASAYLGEIGSQIPFADDRAEAFARLLDGLGEVPRPGAREALLAFAAVGEAAVGEHARKMAERIAGPTPRWATEAGTGDVVGAWRASDVYFGDGDTYAFEIARASGIHVLCVYVDNNIGGIPKDAFLLTSIDDYRTPFERGEAPNLRLDQVPVAEAAAAVRAAVELARRYLDPPADDDLPLLNALIEGHLRFLPPGVAPDPQPLDDDAVAAIATAFLASPEGKSHRRGDDPDILDTILWFANGYNIGGPFRWSPVVVEVFMADWVGRKVLADRAYIARIPVVLASFVRYAGRVRGVPDGLVAETLKAVPEWTAEMLGRGGTPSPFANADAMARSMPGESDDSLAPHISLAEDRDEVAGWLLRMAAPVPSPAELQPVAATVRDQYRANDGVALLLRTLLPWQRLPRRDDRLVAGFAGAWATLAGRHSGDDAKIGFLTEIEPFDWHDIAVLVVDGKPVTAARIGRRLAQAEGLVALADAAARRKFGGLLIDAWTSLGLIDEQGMVTPVGRWAIPAGIAASWGYEYR